MIKVRTSDTDVAAGACRVRVIFLSGSDVKTTLHQALAYWVRARWRGLPKEGEGL